MDRDGLSGALYGDPTVHAEEMDRIFTRGWAFVGHESEIASPGDWATRRLGTEPVVLTRDEGGAVNVVANRCTHRGAACAGRPGATAAT